MRHTTTGLSEDDLSCLTGSSSSTASCNGSSNNNNRINNNNNNNNNNHNANSSNSSSSSSSNSSSSSSSGGSSNNVGSNNCSTSSSSTAPSHAELHQHSVACAAIVDKNKQFTATVATTAAAVTGTGTGSGSGTATVAAATAAAAATTTAVRDAEFRKNLKNSSAAFSHVKSEHVAENGNNKSSNINNNTNNNNSNNTNNNNNNNNNNTINANNNNNNNNNINNSNNTNNNNNTNITNSNNSSGGGGGGGGGGNIVAIKNGPPNNSHCNLSYLPEIIDPLDWQRSRKRKERLDSNSSNAQDRKLIRSNSEELLPPNDVGGGGGGGGGVDQQQQQQQVTLSGIAPNASQQQQQQQQSIIMRRGVDTMRRVSSEDFKWTPYSGSFESSSTDVAVLDPAAKMSNVVHSSDENDASFANRWQQPQSQSQSQSHATSFDAAYVSPFSEILAVGGVIRDASRRSRSETSPARSHRHSPIRNGGAGKLHRDSDDSECEHERRRSSERFCKSRAPPGRKAVGVVKKSGKYMPTKIRGDEHHTYKYDLSALKYERRGFASVKLAMERDRPSGGGVAAAVSDHNDNNLIDFHIIRNGSSDTMATTTTTLTTTSSSSSSSSSNGSSNALKMTPTYNSDSITTVSTTITTIPTTPTTTHVVVDSQGTTGPTAPTAISSAETLPWDSSNASDPTEPMLSRRYAAVCHRPSDCIDTAAKLSKVMPYPQQFHKKAQLLLADDCSEPLSAYRAFTTLGSMKTSDIMHQVIPAMMSFQLPEERLKQVNKRLIALKKKLVQFEEDFEARLGYRPSQAEKLNDKYMTNVLAEVSKLRKEKQELKSLPSSAMMGLKVMGGMDATKKLEKMKATLNEIEQNLSVKRKETNRSDTLDDLNADQLLQEKTAVQHALLYFESLYGRPVSKDERDSARPLYDRYRQLKRMVSRSVVISGCGTVGAPELPTILEHEAMVFESLPQPCSSNNSSDSTSSPIESSNTDNATTTPITTTTAAAAETITTTSPRPSLVGENVSASDIGQLWEQLERTRDEKKVLKRSIREFESAFEEQNGRKMLKSDRRTIEDTYAQYKELKAKARLLQALIKKQISP